MVTPKVETTASPQFAQLLTGAGFPRIYFNGFGIAAAITDVTVILQNGEQPVAAVQAGYSVIKQLAETLNQIVRENERLLGMEHLTLQQAGEKAQAQQAANGNAG